MTLRRLAAAVALSGALAQAPPADSPGTAEAKSAYDAGIAAVRAGDRVRAVASFRKAIEIDPRFVAAHEQFIDTSAELDQQGVGALRNEYTQWAAAHPDNPVYEWALARLADKDWTIAERHLRRAIAIGPSFARAYQDLALIAELKGDNRQRLDYLKKAADLNPEDAAYFFYYASATKSIDPAASIALLQQVADRFPRTERGAQGLYWAAYETTDLDAKLAIYDRLRREFPPETYSWSESGMSDLFDVLVAVDPVKAKALAADMQTRIAATSEQARWRDRGAFAAALAGSAASLARGDARAALAQLDAAAAQRTFAARAALVRARVRAHEAAGNRETAYTTLAAFVAQSPSDETIADLRRVAASLNRTTEMVQADLRARRESAARPAPAFSLPGYPDGRRVALADYRGKVVLVNFFYVSCGPCRGEFPTLQRVLAKYKDRGFVILSLNVLPEEHVLVLPYFQKNGFGFTPLDTTGEWAERTYGARGFPTNFLVDRAGRIVYQPGIIRSPQEQRTFELQIESLLDERGMQARAPH